MHPQYELLVTKLLNGESLPQDLAFGEPYVFHLFSCYTG